MFMVSLAAEAAGGSPAFPPFDPWHFASQLFWLVILFGGLYFVLSRFILPKLGAVIEQRGDTIADDLDEAARLDEQASEAKDAQDKALAEARARARETADKAREKVEAEIAAETQKVDAELAEKLSEAEARIADMRTAALAKVESIAVTATQAMVAKFDVQLSESEAKTAVERNTPA